MTSVVVAIANVVIIAIFAWAVFAKGHSGWWFLLALALLMSTKSCECGDDD